ncbi:MAG: hypothetical protein R3C05_09670 [Pirellulaceae bacterium]
MNRLWAVNASSNGKAFTDQSCSAPVTGDLETCGRASFFLPVQYEPNYEYPLVIWLHDEGGNQLQMPRVMPSISLQNYVGVGVRAPRAGDAMGHGFGWLHNEAGIAITEQAIFDAIETAQSRYSIHPERICLVGHRQGGTMALRIGLRHPSTFAGVISLGGRFPSGSRPLANLKAARKLPMLITFSDDPAGYRVSDICHDLRMWHTANLGLQMRNYDVQDELHPEILSDVNHWIMEKVTGVNTLQAESLCDTVPVEFSAN